MQEKFELMERVEGGRTRLKDRRLFLFEHVLVLSKKRRDDSADQETYFIKETLKVTVNFVITITNVSDYTAKQC